MEGKIRTKNGTPLGKVKKGFKGTLMIKAIEGKLKHNFFRLDQNS